MAEKRKTCLNRQTTDEIKFVEPLNLADTKGVWTSIGAGGEAEALKGNPKKIEGIGGVVNVGRPLDAVRRITHMNTSRDEGDTLFLKHLTIKLMDEVFHKRGEYSRAHVTAPLGSFAGGYYYEFAPGSESFPWSIQGQYSRQEPVDLAEFRRFTNLFSPAGIGVGEDICEADDGRSAKNIVLGGCKIEDLYEGFQLPNTWYRIDFGGGSCPTRSDKFRDYMKEHPRFTKDMGKDMGLFNLASKRAIHHESLNSQEQEKLTELVRGYRERVLKK